MTFSTNHLINDLLGNEIDKNTNILALFALDMEIIKILFACKLYKSN